MTHLPPVTKAGNLAPEEATAVFSLLQIRYNEQGGHSSSMPPLTTLEPAPLFGYRSPPSHHDRQIPTHLAPPPPPPISPPLAPPLAPSPATSSQADSVTGTKRRHSSVHKSPLRGRYASDIPSSTPSSWTTPRGTPAFRVTRSSAQRQQAPTMSRSASLQRPMLHPDLPRSPVTPMTVSPLYSAHFPPTTSTQPDLSPYSTTTPMQLTSSPPETVPSSPRAGPSRPMQMAQDSASTEDMDDQTSFIEDETSWSHSERGPQHGVCVNKPRWLPNERRLLFEAVIVEKQLEKMATFRWENIAKFVGRSKKACKDQWRREVLPSLRRFQYNQASGSTPASDPSLP